LILGGVLDVLVLLLVLLFLLLLKLVLLVRFGTRGEFVVDGGFVAFADDIRSESLTESDEK
jgi:hypothetical protein